MGNSAHGTAYTYMTVGSPKYTYMTVASPKHTYMADTNMTVVSPKHTYDWRISQTGCSKPSRRSPPQLPPLSKGGPRGVGDFLWARYPCRTSVSPPQLPPLS